MAVIVAVTAAARWPAAVVLAAGILIVPLNMRLAGLFAADTDILGPAWTAVSLD